MKEQPSTVFVVDDDPFALRIVAQMLRTAGHVVELFEGPRAFLESEPFKRDGCVVLDVSMPDLSGLELQELILDRGGALPVVFITGSPDVRSSVRAMKGGAVDFLLKPVDRDELLAAVRSALERSALARDARAAREAEEALLSQLTPREREVCELLARGLLNKQIAAALTMAEATVKIHRARVMDKLRVDSIAELSALMERQRSR